MELTLLKLDLITRLPGPQRSNRTHSFLFTTKKGRPPMERSLAWITEELK